MVRVRVFVPLGDLMNLWKLDWIVNYLCVMAFIFQRDFDCFRFKWFMFLICFAWHRIFCLPLLLSSRVPNSKSSYIERRKLLVDCNIHTFLNRIQRNLIKIKFSDKMLLSHRTEMDSLKRKCHQICMNLFRFGALFSLYHTSTQSAGDWKTLTEAVLHGILSQFLQRQYYSI